MFLLFLFFGIATATKLVHNTSLSLGFSLSFGKTKLAVGAPDSGTVFLYRTDGTYKTISGGVSFGTSVSFDETKLAVGGISYSNGVGGTWIYRRNGTHWIQDAFFSGGSSNSYHGFSVSLMKSTLAVGAPGDQNGRGAVWIYVEKQYIWELQAKIVASDSVGSVVQQGYSVSLSRDGNTVAFGGIGDSYHTGAAWVYIRKGMTWVQQAKLIGNDLIENNIYFGSSVSLAGNGNTLAIGGKGDNWSTGATWIFVRSGTTWKQQAKLVGSGYNKDLGTINYAGVHQGASVSLSRGGNILAVGSTGNRSFVGTTWLFTRQNNTWIQNKIIQYPDGIDDRRTVSSENIARVSLSLTGKYLATGYPIDHSGVGAVWINQS